MGQTNENILPATTGLSLGTPNQQWNLNANNAIVGGLATVSSEQYVAGLYDLTTYSFSILNGVVYAKTHNAAYSDVSGTDAAVVINTVLNTLAAVGGRLIFNEGIYPINSLTQETMAAYSNFYYGIGIPSTPTGSWVQWHFLGASRPAVAFNFDSSAPINSINSGGVIFSVSQSALNVLSNTNVAQILWQRPDSTFFFTNEIHIRNIGFRFPSNQRGSEVACNLWAASSLDLENLLADFSGTYNSILNGSLPASGSYGFATSFGSAGNLQHLKNIAAVGYDTGFDIEGEHVVMDTCTSAICTTAGVIGRSIAAINPSPIFHPILLIKFTDQECQNGWVLGGELQLGTQIDFLGYDVEKKTTTNFARVNNMTEVHPGNSSGIITFVPVTAGIGIGSDAPFSGGGGANFTVWGPKGTLSIPGVTGFNNVATVNNGLPNEIAMVVLTGGQAAITNHALFTPAGGLYRVTCTAKVTQVATTSSTLGGATGFTVTYTDATDSTASVLVGGFGGTNAGNFLSSAASSSVLINAKGGVPVTFSYGYTSSGVTAMQYQITVLVEAF